MAIQSKAKARQITKALMAGMVEKYGAGKVDGFGSTEWAIVTSQGTIQFTLFEDKPFEFKRGSSCPWVASRLDGEQYVGPDGYSLGNHPYPFSRTSGKYNFHPTFEDSIETIKSEFMAHLERI